MKKSSLAPVLTILISCLFLPAAFGQSSPPVAFRDTLAKIQTNADAVQHNAAIYQWKRVNLEVDRIIASEKALLSALPQTSDSKALSERIVSLRKARLNHEAESIVLAARDISTLCKRLSD